MTTRSRRARLEPIELPEFGMPDAEPRMELAFDTLFDRIANLTATGSTECWLRPARRVGRSGAQREHRVPDRLRSAVRGGPADRRPVRRPGAPAGQRVLRRRRAQRRCRCGRHVPGPQPSGPAPGPVAAVARDPRRRRNRAGEPGRRRRVEDIRGSRQIDLPAYLIDELRGHWRGGWSRTRPTS